MGLGGLFSAFDLEAYLQSVFVSYLIVDFTILAL
jgi:hypothetical protein